MPARSLVLVSHARTAATRAAAIAGRDEDLDEIGVVAARGLADALPRTPARAYAAPALASRRTAALLGLAAAETVALDDLDLGKWTGQPLAALARETPDALAAWRTDPGYDGHGGETLHAFYGRVARWLAGEVLAEGLGIAVTSGAVLRAALVGLLDAPPSAFWSVDTPPLTALVLSSDGRRFVLRRFGPLAAAFKASDG